LTLDASGHAESEQRQIIDPRPPDGGKTALSEHDRARGVASDESWKLFLQASHAKPLRQGGKVGWQGSASRSSIT